MDYVCSSLSVFCSCGHGLLSLCLATWSYFPPNHLFAGSVGRDLETSLTLGRVWVPDFGDKQ